MITDKKIDNVTQLQIIDDKDDYKFFLPIMSKIINSKRSGPKTMYCFCEYRKNCFYRKGSRMLSIAFSVYC